MRGRFGVLLALLLVGVGTASGGEGRKEIFQPIVLDGSVADITGRYFLSRNITASAATAPIRILGTGVESVDLDLNGFTVTGFSTQATVIEVSNLRSIRIHNGSVISPAPDQDATPAVGVFGAAAANDRFTLEGVNISGGSLGIYSVEALALRRNLLTESKWGMQIYGDPATPFTGVIENNVVRQMEVHGIDVYASTNLLVRDNQVEDAEQYGIFSSESRGLRIVGNTVTNDGVGGLGIFVELATACSLVGNQSSNSGLSGISLKSSTGCSVLDNVTTGNAHVGLRVDLSSQIKIRGNIASGNGEEGIFLFDNTDLCEVRDNTLNDNGSFGLHFDTTSDDNTYGGNTIRGNSGAGCGNPGPATCGGGDLCDDGTGNHSFGDNLAPGLPPC